MNTGHPDRRDGSSDSAGITQGLIACTLLQILLSGCTGSVHPLLTEKDMLQTTDLSGQWLLNLQESDQASQQLLVTLSARGTSDYDLELKPGQSAALKQVPDQTSKWPTRFTLQIGSIDGQTYAQLQARRSTAGPPVALGIPVWWFGRLALTEDTISFAPVLDDHGDFARENKLPHIRSGSAENSPETVFTGTTAELQQMLRSNGDRLFRSRPIVLKRMKSSTD